MAHNRSMAWVLGGSEEEAIVAFMKTLTGKQPVIEYPVLPVAENGKLVGMVRRSALLLSSCPPSRWSFGFATRSSSTRSCAPRPWSRSSRPGRRRSSALGAGLQQHQEAAGGLNGRVAALQVARRSKPTAVPPFE